MSYYLKGYLDGKTAGTSIPMPHDKSLCEELGIHDHKGRLMPGKQTAEQYIASMCKEIDGMRATHAIIVGAEAWLDSNGLEQPTTVID